MDNGDDLLDRRPKLLPQLHEPTAFCLCDVDTLGQLAPENPVLRLEVLDHPDHFRFSCSRQKQQEGVQELRHDSRIPWAIEIWQEATFWDPATPAYFPRKSAMLGHRLARAALGSLLGRVGRVPQNYLDRGT